MRVVCLYGPPGVGKLTVGRELAALTGFKLFHNHLVVDLVTSVFPRWSDVWVRLSRRIRRDIFIEAMHEGIDLVMTLAYRGTPAHAEAVRAMFEPVRDGGGTVLFVQLTCAHDELLTRLRSDSRRAQGKLTDPTVLVELYDLSAALPVKPHLRLDTTNVPPAESAARIAAHYCLPCRPAGDLGAHRPVERGNDGKTS